MKYVADFDKLEYQDYNANYPTQPSVMSLDIEESGATKLAIELFTYHDEDYSEVIISRWKKDNYAADTLYTEVIDEPLDVHSQKANNILFRSLKWYLENRGHQVEITNSVVNS